jgi:hypothetical protein
LPPPVDPKHTADLGAVEIRKKHWSQLTGLFLIDRTGIIRWTHVEAERAISDFGRYPGNKDILAVRPPRPARRSPVEPQAQCPKAAR